MSKDLTQNLMDVVPDFDGKSSLPMLDVSENVLSLAKTITSSAVNLYCLNTKIEDTRIKTQLLADYNEKTFALHNKRIDKNCEHTDKAIAYAGKIIDYGIENDKDMMMLQGLNAMVQLVTHEALPELPDFEKQLDNGEKLQLG